MKTSTFGHFCNLKMCVCLSLLREAPGKIIACCLQHLTLCQLENSDLAGIRGCQMYLCKCSGLCVFVFLCIFACVHLSFLFVFTASHLASRCQLEHSDFAGIRVAEEGDEDVEQSELPVDRVPELRRIVDQNIRLTKIYLMTKSHYLPGKL